ncbi:MAG: DNA polymerase III subunit beta [Hydrogenophilus sp.]|nr:DNA polymerase III subunit beta [Hydrogenophilus sp.]
MLSLKAPRDVLLAPLAAAGGVVERRQTKPILGCVLLERAYNALTVTATDLDAQIVVTQPLGEFTGSDGSLAVPAKKLIDIVKALPEGVDVHLTQERDHLKIHAGRSRFSLQTLPAEEFPLLEIPTEGQTISLSKRLLRRLLSLTAFAMAQQDVRYYLNGVFLQIVDGTLHAVATDGHRLAHVEEPLAEPPAAPLEAILPRKAVLELERLLTDSDEAITLLFAERQVTAALGSVRFTTKTIEGRFPDYQRVLPKNNPIRIVFDRIELLKALQRVSLLTEEKMRAVKLALNAGLIRISSHNIDREEAIEEIEIHYEGAPLEIGFNVSYLTDVLTTLSNEVVHLSLKDSMAAALITTPEDERFQYVVMPMRL